MANRKPHSRHHFPLPPTVLRSQPAILSAPLITPSLTLQHQAAAAITVESSKPSSEDFEHVLSELAKLQATVKTLTKANRKPYSRHCFSTPTPQPSSEFCWYHQKFGDDACKCNFTQTGLPGTSDDNPPGISYSKCCLLHIHDP